MPTVNPFLYAFVALVAVLALAGFLFQYTFEDSRSLQEYAAQVVQACEDSSYRPGCYDREIPKLMEDLSMEEAFEVTKLVQQQDSEYWYCHVLGHELSAQETAKDPENWKEVIGRCPLGMCSNGCIHGAFQERFRAESLPDAEVQELKPELEGICEKREGWNPTNLEQATCYHALGHLTMYITEADLEKSLALCNELAQKQDGRDFTHLCYDGSFMQIFQPLEPEDIALVQGKQPAKDKVQEFCTDFEGEQRVSCWIEAWPLFFEQIMDPAGLVEHCSVLGFQQQYRCFNGLFYVVTAQLQLNEQKMIEFCSNIPAQKGQCFANAASRMIETDAHLIDRAVRLCKTAESFGVGKACFEELLLYSTYNFHPGSEEFFHLCESLPASWGERCLARGGSAR